MWDLQTLRRLNEAREKELLEKKPKGLDRKARDRDSDQRSS